jgi:hypothetical protein
LEVSPNASYLAELRQGRVIRITDRRSNVLEYRIERVTQEIDQPTVTVTAVPVIHDLNRYFLWETLGDIPAFAQGATDLTATEWLTGFVLPVLTAAGVTYVDLDTIDSERTLNLEWQGQTVMWLLNTLVEGTDLDIVYRIANPGAKVERYALSLERRGADAARPRCLVGDNAEALEWTVDGDPQANVIIPQGLLPAGGEERSNIGEYVARVTAVDGNQLTVEDPDGNPSPVYVEDQATELYLELLVPPILTGALS